MKAALSRLREPSSLMLIAVNAVPIIGILLWRWDAFLLLMLYWMETAILGFWAIVIVAISPVKALGSLGASQSRIGIVAFLLLHSGIFMGVHFMILWELFAGGWASRIHGVGEFFKLIVIGQTLWLPLLVLFVLRGLVVSLTILEPKWIPGWQQQPVLVMPEDEGSFPLNGPLVGFYARIIIMQFVLILGGVVAVLTGAGMALILLVIIKTAIDLGLFLNIDEWVAARAMKRSI